MLNSTHKTIISPFAGVTFAAVALTGILLLFHQKLPAVHEIHRWGGLLFVAAGVVHLILNWRPFIAYFKDTRAMWGSLAGALTIALMIALFPHGKEDSDDYGKHDREGQYYPENRHHR